MTNQVRQVPAKTDPAIPGPSRGTIRVDVTSLKRRLAAVAEERLGRQRAVDGEPRLGRRQQDIISRNDKKLPDERLLGPAGDS